MKKALLILFLAICTNANAQFILTSTGFVDSLNAEKDYVVLELQNRTKEDLYVATKTFIVSTYNSPKNVISENMPTSISIFGMADIVAKTIGIPTSNELTYKIVFTFKDGRIKIEPYMVSLKVMADLDAVLFNKKGEVRKVMQKHHAAVQNYINGIVKDFKNSINNVEGEW